MWNYSVLLLCLSGYCLAGPVLFKRNIPIGAQQRGEDAVTSMENMSESESASSSNSAAESNPAEMMIMSTLTLPSNATSIRADITDNFSCDNKTYGYYADVENECQIFHVCLPVTYADGKENTFRWSFICPEETVFSQDSFTCMRPEDMTITCEESLNYYELNRNFGMVEQDSEKENSDMPAAEQDKEVIQPVMNTVESVSKPEIMKPVMAMEEPVKPVEQPMKVQKPNRRKPGLSYAAQKKPVNTLPLRKIPHYQAELNTISDQHPSEAMETAKPVEEEEIKPIVQKFQTRRPAPAMSNTFKDTIQSSKPETMFAIRSDLYNQKRKRPTMFNKKPVEEDKIEEVPVNEESPVEEKVPEQSFSQVDSKMSNGSAETQEADSEVQTSETQEVFVKASPDTVKVEEPQVMESEQPAQVLEAFEEIPAVIAEVMETAEEETKKEEEVVPVEETQNQTPVETQNIEAEESQTAEGTPTVEKSQTIEEEPQVVEEMLSVQEPETVEKEIETIEEDQTVDETANAEEAQIVDTQQTAEETQAEEEEVKAPEETHSADEISAEEILTPAQTVPAVDSEITPEDSTADEPKTVLEPEIPEEPKPVEDNQDSEAVQLEEQSIEESKPAEETKDSELSEEIQNPEPVMLVDSPVSAEDVKQEETEEIVDIKSALPAENESAEVQSSPVASEPAIFEENSEEAVAALVPLQTVEEMEAEKPAEAPESMPATDEMAEHDPIVQEMFEETDKKQTIGGFKPVDPVMAAEAEQLIADFINTLRNNDFTNEHPATAVMPMEMSSVEQIEQQPEQEIPKVEEAPESVGQIEEIKVIEPEAMTDSLESQPQIIDENQTVEVVDDNKEPQEVSENEKSSDSNEVSFLKSAEVQSSEETQKQEEPSVAVPVSVPNMIISHMPQEIYQIPVQVISTPIQEMPALPQQQQSEEQVIENSKPEINTEEETPAVIMGGYKPLSIDDIVELVKERLDQKPKDDMETPMQLDQVLSEVKPNADKVEEEAAPASAEQQQQSQETLQSAEEIVMPIYHRLAEPDLVDDAEVQTDSQGVSTAEADTVLVPSTQEKSNRSYRSRSMLTAKLDPRKRRFLFRSDDS